MSSPDTFTGWLGLDEKSAQGNLVWQSYTPKPFTPTDVDIAISHCGICGTDIHTLRSGWGKSNYPVCPGHEIVGTLTRIGASVTRFTLGERVGVGAQSGSCLRADCEECAAGMEQHCAKLFTGTYNGKFADGSKSYGGYAERIRLPAHFVVKIPEALESRDVAPMLCGGITVFSPLKKNGAGPGKKVGIVGVGGLGHFGLLFAKALGCEKVVAISRTQAKRKDAQAMGADDFIATEDGGWAKKHARSLDIIVSTVSGPNMPLQKYLQLLRTNGTFVQVGAPEDPMPAFSAFALIAKGCKIAGSQIGSPPEIEEMLKFAAEKGVKPWIQERRMKDANQAIVDMEDGKARYRYVLVNEENEHAKL
ncbi:GroES-like protein [Lophium mytilinum]|uniref:alcohol dehydrogenase (NADP(+)) n=1 Tax=Lophium mytilinum TaxID=390894 RepID=A0A6A6R2H6_9PEZI|nr:GroES-like protein [Lophium mytilinum]